MHNCLRIPEIVTLIFQYVYENDENDKQHAKTVANLARTCKAFTSPALGILWHETTLTRFLSLLPDDSWTSKHTFSELSGHGWNPRKGMDFTRIPTPVEWERFRLYANRVKKLEITFPKYDSKIGQRIADVHPSMICALPRYGCLPSLRHLRCAFAGLSRPFFETFLVPSLTTIEFRYHYHGHHQSFDFFAQKFMLELPTKVPRLQKLVVTIDEPSCSCETHDNIAASFSLDEPLRNLPSLRHLSHPFNISYDTIRHLGSATQAIEVFESTTDIGVFIKCVNGKTGLFPSLRYLGVRCDKLAPFETLFAKFPPTQLHGLRVVYTNPVSPTPQELFHFFTLLVDHVSRTNFISLQIIHDPQLGFVRPSGQLATCDHLQPLFSLKKLEHLELGLHYPVYLNEHDDGPERVAKAWPRIKTLYLQHHVADLTKPDMTLGQLALFAEHCPNLESLRLTLDLTTLPEPEPLNSPGNGPACSKVKNLNLMHTVTMGEHQEEPVAMILSSLFPSLKTIEFHRYPELEFWDRILEQAQTFSMIRKQERRRLWGPITNSA
ncbi:hypothetical protein CC1G_09500 [Coprinopsis cinerea okayama7|uniref:F-box domain-containing protein n=1 Tax=Coprinopsis cinerea (strain Okayama-7 / 130 / ATCC MYA-4618 / FGSC 9003) TaxID=240176 RepID=A8P0R7_COPC7|nr:hypothetical protein CC1G_09500 [Coprinopsis cinerea okayama7\|eukprot:XP_001837949.1 hypothetical protein CC1G_09500 [Coprinopsis cinerea okayama7\